MADDIQALVSLINVVDITNHERLSVQMIFYQRLTEPLIKYHLRNEKQGFSK